MIRDITQVNYREPMRRSLGLKICWKMEIKIDETKRARWSRVMVSVVIRSGFAIGNLGSLCVTRDITQVNMENI